MNVGKTLFAQVMEFVPWKTFGRIVDRHKGDACIRTLSCADLSRVMAFAQLGIAIAVPVSHDECRIDTERQPEPTLRKLKL